MSPETTTFDTVLYLSALCGDPATELGCDDIQGNGGEVLTAQSLAPGTYFLLVDGQDALSSGDYELTLTLTPLVEVCDDGLDNDDDGLADCEDDECAQDPYCVNEAPSFNSGAPSEVPEGVEYTYHIAVTDPDVPAQALTCAKSAEDTCNGTLTGCATYTFTPTEAQGGTSCVVGLTVTDDGDPPLSAHQAFTVTIAEDNQPPRFTSTAPATAVEDVLYIYAAAATDDDLPAQGLSCTISGDDTCGGALLGCTYSFVPTEAQGGTTCVVGLRVTDDGDPANSAGQDSTVTIDEVNLAPSFISTPPLDATEGVLYTYTITVTDPDLPAQTLSCNTNGVDTCGGVLTGCFTYTFTPTEPQGGATCVIGVTVRDDGNPELFSYQRGDVTVAEDNKPPRFTSTAPAFATELEEYSYTATGADDDDPAQTLTCSVSAADTCGGLLAGCTYTFTPPNLPEGSTCVVGLTLTDSGNPAQHADQTTTISIVENNQAPRFTSIPPTNATEGEIYTYDIAVTDPDLPDQALACSLQGDTCGGILTGCTTYTFTPTEAQGGSTCTVGLRVTDNGEPALFGDQATVVTIAESNQAPGFLSTPPASATEDVPYAYIIIVADPDLPAQDLTCSLEGDTCGGALTDCASYTFTPGEAQGGSTCTVGLRVTDSGGRFADQSQTVTIAEDNKAPTICNLPATATGIVGQTTTFAVSTSDPDLPEDARTYSLSLSSCPFTPTVNPATGVVRWTCDASRTCAVDVTVTDDGTPARRDTETLNISCPGAVGTVDLGGVVYDVDVEGHIAYVADDIGGLQIVDVSDPTQPTVVGTYDSQGMARAVDVSGIYAYMANDSLGLLIVDVSNPSAPTLVGTHDTPGAAFDVQVSGIYAYVADFNSGLQIIDVSNPSAPTSVDSCATSMALAVHVVGDTAYVADGTSGLRIIDVSNPTNPTLTGTYPTPGFARGVHVSGRTAYVSDDSSGLQIIDVSDPVAPALLTTYSTPSFVLDVQVSGSSVYVANEAFGLKIIDVSNPSAPSLRGAHETPRRAESVTVEGGIAYVGDGGTLLIYQVSLPETPREVASGPSALSQGVFRSGPYLYEAANDLRIYDISDPAAAFLVGSYATACDGEDVVVDGNHAYLAEGTCGLRVLDVSDPAHPLSLALMPTPTGKNVRGVTTQAGYAYVAAAADGLMILDISDPASPVTLSTTDTPGNVHDVVVMGSTAYLADGTSGLRILDVSDPMAPSLIGEVDTLDQALDVFVSGLTAYVADRNSGLLVFDITDPASPVLTGTYDTPGQAYGVFVRGSRAFVADHGAGGLQIIDVSNPYSPVLAGFRVTGTNSQGVFVSGIHAYLADGLSMRILEVASYLDPAVEEGSYDTPGMAENVFVSANLAFVKDTFGGGGEPGGLRIINVANPASPTLMGELGLSGSVNDMVVSGAMAYVANGVMGLRIIDASHPAGPTLVGTYDTPSAAEGIHLSGAIAYVADSNSGLQIIDVSDPAAPALLGSLDTPGLAADVCVSDGYAYVADGSGGLQIIDVSNPASPTLETTYATPDDAWSVVIRGHHAYVVDGSGLRIIDVTDPSNPSLTGGFDSLSAIDVTVDGDRAYLAAGSRGLQILDASDPSFPVLVGTVDTPGSAYGVFVDGDHAYVADNAEGLRIIRLMDTVEPEAAPCP